ncbi:N(6)-adenine-specific methyltransferase METTL4 [Euwallacea similis]|uniref:N(6)-adenine-specific methyltransferase METTL4 n=1 Tax=Euwallacea similis TaxID=1736056 RepID=UPI00344C8013
MSILYEHKDGILLCSEKYFNCVTSKITGSPKINNNLFKIPFPYRSNATARRKAKKIPNKVAETTDSPNSIEIATIEVQHKYAILKPILQNSSYLKNLPPTIDNKKALNTADFVYEETGKHQVKIISGGNFGPPVIKPIQGAQYIFPENCRFFCNDVQVIGRELSGEKFDLILLDPPWWNKYIRRKRKKCPHAYDMMFNCNLQAIPIEDLLSDSGIVVVWCTNSSQHLNFLTNTIFPKWKVSLIAKWYWLKITLSGEPICEFSEPPGKQPFEHILIAMKGKISNQRLPPDGKLIVTVPSAIHSHKPPLTEVLKSFMPQNAKCLEIFARYLLPNFTSYGNEVLRFQHESLYLFNGEK